MHAVNLHPVFFFWIFFCVWLLKYLTSSERVGQWAPVGWWPKRPVRNFSPAKWPPGVSTTLYQMGQ